MIVYVPEDVISRLNERLKATPEKMPDVLRNTINSTAKSARREVAKLAREQYTIKTGDFNKAMEIENATQRYLQATIHTKGSPVPLYGFKRRNNTRAEAAKAQVLSSGSLKKLVLKGGADNGKDLKAFVQTVKNKDGSKHTGIFQRMTREERQKSTSKKRNPIKQLYAPSIPQMTGNEKRVYSVVQPFIVENLRNNLEKHIAKVMEGMK